MIIDIRLSREEVEKLIVAYACGAIGAGLDPEIKPTYHRFDTGVMAQTFNYVIVSIESEKK